MKNEGISAIADLITKLPKLIELDLNLGSNAILEEGAQRLSEALKTCKHLKTLVLKVSYCGIEDNAAKHLADGFSYLASHNTITEFKLQTECNYWENDGKTAIINSITQF